jgi:uncharacterized membrane protein YjgN (DUF898 family)
MMSTVDPATDALATALPLYDHPIAFTGRGEEYFRIWAINTLLMLVTLGLYWPWANVRKTKYFCNKTTVDGHALDFLGDPHQMVRGMLISVLLMVMYLASLYLSFLIWAVVTAVILIACPLLIRAFWRFQMENTSWRGVRFHFTGNVTQAYYSVGLCVAVVLVPLGLLRWWGFPENPKFAPSLPALITAYLVLISSLGLVFPYLFWRIKHYQLSNLNCGAQHARLRTDITELYREQFKNMLLGVSLVALVFPAIGSMAYLGMGSMNLRGNLAGMLVFGVVLAGVFFFLFNVLVRCRWTASVRNLIWSRTGNDHFRFTSRISAKRYARLQLNNHLLIVLTLGFYWPYAVMSTRRAWLKSMTLRTRGVGLSTLFDVGV